MYKIFLCVIFISHKHFVWFTDLIIFLTYESSNGIFFLFTHLRDNKLYLAHDKRKYDNTVKLIVNSL